MPNIVQKDDKGMFREERQTRTQKTRGVIYALLASFVFLATLWCLFFSKWFDAKKYEINTLHVLGREAVVGEIEGYFSQSKHWPWGNKNIFFVKENDLRDYLMKKLFVEKVTVDKVYPDILRLKIWERQRSVILVTTNNYYIVDDYGVITDIADEATVSSTKKFLTSTTPLETSKEIFVVLSTSTQFVKGQELTSSGRVRGWLDMTSDLRDAGIWFKALIQDPNIPNNVNIILKENKRVIFDTAESIDAQIETLRSFIATKPKWGEINEYIDVRVPGRIYYK